jgi:hypothetical protein
MDPVHQGSPVARRPAAHAGTDLPALRRRVFGILWPLAYGKRLARTLQNATFL